MNAPDIRPLTFEMSPAGTVWETCRNELRATHYTFKWHLEPVRIEALKSNVDQSGLIVMFPSVILLGYSIELGLKTLIIRHNETNNGRASAYGHNPTEPNGRHPSLWDQLSQTDKDGLEGHWNTSQPTDEWDELSITHKTFYETLDDTGDLFVRTRYAYESPNPTVDAVYEKIAIAECLVGYTDPLT